MPVEPSFALVGALIGVPARANMMAALMDGRAQTASELAFVAGVMPQTASSHLAKLTDAGLLAVEKARRKTPAENRGRHEARGEVRCRRPRVNLERVMGIEPTLEAWEAPVLPLNYTRVLGNLSDVSNRSK